MVSKASVMSYMRKLESEKLGPPTPPPSPDPESPPSLITPYMSQLPSSANLIQYEAKYLGGEGGHALLQKALLQPQRRSIAEDKREFGSQCRSMLSTLWRLPVLLLLLYTFILSLDFLSTSFRLIAGKTAGTVFQNNELLGNPIVGLMIGVLFTVLVQSSSTCTSVIVSMVSSGILEVQTAIPLVMGANIGTSLTSTLVSLGQAGDKRQFERAFSGATVHDCFNWLTVFVLLPLEVGTGYLNHLTLWLTSQMTSMSGTMSGGGKINILGAITKPLTKKVVQIDKAVLKCWSQGECQEDRLLKVWCHKNAAQNFSESDEFLGEKCNFLLNIESLSDGTIGAILLVASLAMLTTCLILIVKLLQSLLEGAVADLIKKTLNADFPGMPWLTGYIAIIAGAVLTFIVQSSSVFTSTLTPLVGVGLIQVERVYPLTLGSNLGTTTTALLASLAADGAQNFQNSVQIALCHLFFNLTGILIFYPIPIMRWPLTLCQILGRTTAEYRWFAIFYLLCMFFFIPASIMGLSLAGQTVFLAVLIPLAMTLTLVVIVNILQKKCTRILPDCLRTWNFLPIWMRSLQPLDNVIKRCRRCFCSRYDTVRLSDNLQV